MSDTRDAEHEHYPVYLDSKRNWHPRQTKAEHWEHDFHGFCGKVFFLSDGRIGMEYGGRVIVRSIELWMQEQDQEQEEIDFSINPEILGTFTAEVTRIQEPDPELHFETEGENE